MVIWRNDFNGQCVCACGNGLCLQYMEIGRFKNVDLSWPFFMSGLVQHVNLVTNKSIPVIRREFVATENRSIIEAELLSGLNSNPSLSHRSFIFSFTASIIEIPESSRKARNHSNITYTQEFN